MLETLQKKQKKRENPLSIRFSRNVKRRIDDFSRIKKRSKASIVQEAVENYIDLQDWQIRGVESAILEMDNGKGVDGEMFLEWMTSLGGETEKQNPFIVSQDV